MLADALDLLVCPACGSDLDLEERTVLCQRGHSFDVARQGYVSLLAGAATKLTGDSADMITARGEFLDAGHFDPIATAVAAAVGEDSDLGNPRILEIGAGTGHYLARSVDMFEDAVGLGVDISKAAARRTARAHPRVASIVADAWQNLPVRTGSCTHALSIFSPRNPDEIRRILCADGSFVVVTPTQRHLGELIEPLGMVRVDDDKTRRLGESMAGRFDRVDRHAVDFTMELDVAAIAAVVGMGPTARHLTPEQRSERIATLPTPTTVTASVVVATYRPRLAMTSA
ncbi:putative RNA methyltransferase [Antrihabitans spumae]|uniref:RNA methyltransferase n=1 Tax=Antrihabitans spumae TaxID=3373370 RepID=A0ABW7KU74_9NOCA